jgi:hypothetical protein
VGTSTLQVGADQVFSEVGGATVGMMHDHDIREFQESIERENVVHSILRMTCNHSDNDCLSQIESEDLLGNYSRVGAADYHDLGWIRHFRKGWQWLMSGYVLFVPLDEFCNSRGSHGAEFVLRRCCEELWALDSGVFVKVLYLLDSRLIQTSQVGKRLVLLC